MEEITREYRSKKTGKEYILFADGKKLYSKDDNTGASDINITEEELKTNYELIAEYYED